MAALAAAAPTAASADTYGYGAPGPAPAAVAAPGSATLAYTVTAPAGGGVSTFSLRRSGVPTTPVIVGMALAWCSPTTAPAPADTPTLTVTGARLDGPGALTAPARPPRSLASAGAASATAQPPGRRAELPAPARTGRKHPHPRRRRHSRPRGYFKDPALQLTPTAWQPAASDPAGAAGEPVQIVVPRSSGRADNFRFTAIKDGGRQRLGGIVWPNRRGQRVQIIGLPVTKATQAGVYDRLSPRARQLGARPAGAGDDQDRCRRRLRHRGEAHHPHGRARAHHVRPGRRHDRGRELPARPASLTSPGAAPLASAVPA